MIDSAQFARLSALRNRYTSSPDQEIDPIASRYTDIFEDWQALIDQGGGTIGPIIEDLCGHSHGLRVLDPMCGPGTHVFGLAARGHRVVGADRSGKMIDIARLECAKRGSGARFAVANLFREAFFARPALYDAAICLGNSIAWFEDKGGPLMTLIAIRRRLRPGSPVIIGLRDYDRILDTNQTLEGPFHFLRGKRPRTFHETWDWFNDGSGRYRCCLYLDYHARHGISTRTFQTILRAVRSEELRDALRLTGFKLREWRRLGPRGTGDHSVYRLGIDECLATAVAV
jgi:SAM-dependent methyltransferase